MGQLVAKLSEGDSMALFRNYEECESVIIKMTTDLSDESVIKIIQAIDVCNSLLSDKDKCFRLTQTYLDSLWDIPKAIERGFHKYFKEEVKETKKLLSYHKKHCDGNTKCVVCKIMNNNITRMRNVNERQRPKLCP